MALVSTRNTRWIVRSRNAPAEARLQREIGVTPLLAALLVARGWTEPAEAEKFLNPQLSDLHDPALLPDYAPARDCILGARERKEIIYVHGDYDVDGVTSAAIFTRFLRKIGCQVVAHVPHRMKEGYGIHPNAVEDAHEQGAKLFLTCDCGGGAVAQVEQANSRGMRVVVTDHHQLGDTLPAAEAVINPHRSDSRYPFDKLSGAGVAFKLCEGLTQELGMQRSQFQRAYLDLAALGTVVDVMDLQGENRIIAAFGLAQLTNTKKPGLRALKEVAEVKGPVTTYMLGYVLGPRLNAAGRVDDAAIALELMLENHEDRALEIARRIEALNQQRREEQDRILAEAIERVTAEGSEEKPVIVVSGEGWHKGIVGIVAGQLAERYHRPTFVFSIDPESGIYHGSARSIPGFHLANAISENIHLFLGGGGHAEAAGCSFEGKRSDEVRTALEEYAAVQLTDEMLEKRIYADIEVNPEELTIQSIEDVSRMAPFGKGNPEPVFTARNIEVAQIRPTRNPRVVQLGLRAGGPVIKGVTFNLAEKLADKAAGFTADVLFKADVDAYNGLKRVQWEVRELSSYD
jgi:single-stranded-DNA-specific exonuclease